MKEILVLDFRTGFVLFTKARIFSLRVYFMFEQGETCFFFSLRARGFCLLLFRVETKLMVIN